MEEFIKAMNSLARSVDSWIGSLVRSEIADDRQVEPNEIVVPLDHEGRRTLRIALVADDAAVMDALSQDLQTVLGDFLSAYGKIKAEVEGEQQKCSV